VVLLLSVCQGSLGPAGTIAFSAREALQWVDPANEPRYPGVQVLGVLVVKSGTFGVVWLCVFLSAYALGSCG